MNDQMNTTQRGYNLVEIAIVLVVALMMASWLVGNYYEFQKDQRVRETERRIDVIKDAIAEYAVAHRIKLVSLYDSSAADRIYWHLSPDRPYLPCPDITGDGLEDRLPLLNLAGDIDIMEGYGTFRGNECYRDKGLVPWRTLGTPPADAWGNHFSYRVDPEFANSLLGFDEQTKADDSSNLGLDSPLSLTVRADGRALVVKTTVFPASVDISVNTGDVQAIALWGDPVRSDTASPSLLCNRSPCSHAQIENITHGDIASVAMTLQTGGYANRLPVYAVYDGDNNIVNGLPVVIVSHGQNGYGAVSSQREAGAYGCNAFPNVVGHADERQNAYASASVLHPVGCDIAVAGGNQHGFVVRAHSEVAGEEYDDVVGWMSTEELITRLTHRGVFPVEKLPPLGLEGY